VEPGRPTLHPGYIIHADVLDDLLATVQELGWEIVSIDQVHERLVAQRVHVRARSDVVRPFACFTCDDGYSDNLTFALPLFRKHRLPLCVYIATGLIERSIFYWWGANEELVFKSEQIELPPFGTRGPRTVPARSLQEKLIAYRALETLCHHEGEGFFPILREIYKRCEVNPERSLDRDALTIAQLRVLASDSLVTVGAHCVNHGRLSQMTAEEARREMEVGRRILENWLDAKVDHLAYPFGRSDACGPREFALAKVIGFKTAVTTRQGNLFLEHRDHLECLPRRTIPLSRFNLRNVLFGVETLIRNEQRFRAN
jgi:peptidoglycan/xylan/chitin deacetylase (PgdA/CDA1 family)